MKSSNTVLDFTVIVGKKWQPTKLMQHYFLEKPKKRDRPYLILDIRDQEQYKQGRIVTSKSYPAVRLSRSVNYETRDMYRYVFLRNR